MAEVAAIVSAALENSHITATLSGGAAVTIFSDNAYESKNNITLQLTLDPPPERGYATTRRRLQCS